MCSCVLQYKFDGTVIPLGSHDLPAPLAIQQNIPAFPPIAGLKNYRKISNIRRTKSQNLDASRLIL